MHQVKQLQSAKKDHDELKTDHDELRKDHDELRKDHDEVKQSHNATLQEVDKLRRQLKGVRKAVNKSSAKIESNTKVIARMAQHQGRHTSWMHQVFGEMKENSDEIEKMCYDDEAVRYDNYHGSLVPEEDIRDFDADQPTSSRGAESSMAGGAGGDKGDEDE
jgi:DNA repair exonuclease SbcCD ATPase subunit